MSSFDEPISAISHPDRVLKVLKPVIDACGFLRWEDSGLRSEPLGAVVESYCGDTWRPWRAEKKRSHGSGLGIQKL